MASFFRARREAEVGVREGVHTVGVTMSAPDDDPVLEAQLAHLDAIEQRHEALYARQLAEAARAEAERGEPALPEEAWPAAIGEPPTPEGTTLQPYVAWIERARAVLLARASRNRDELQVLSSQWVHISRNASRFDADDVAGVAEALAQARERIAADETCAHLLLLVRAWLRAWEEVAGAGAEVVGVADRWGEGPPAPPADVELVRRLLDEGAADRVGDARRLLEAVLETLSSVSLDMEVVQRHAERSPVEAAGELRGLQERLAGAVEDLRAQPGTERFAQAEGEPLHATLRRCVDHYQARLAGDVAWSGGEPADPATRAAVLWIVQEFLAACAAAGATRAAVVLATSPEAAVLRLTTDAAGGDAGAEPAWVLRCRARAAVAGGSLGGDAASGWTEVEVRFPTVAAAAD